MDGTIYEKLLLCLSSENITRIYRRAYLFFSSFLTLIRQLFFLGAGCDNVTISHFYLFTDGIFTTAGHTVYAMACIAMKSNTNKSIIVSIYKQNKFKKKYYIT